MKRRRRWWSRTDGRRVLAKWPYAIYNKRSSRTSRRSHSVRLIRWHENRVDSRARARATTTTTTSAFLSSMLRTLSSSSSSTSLSPPLPSSWSRRPEDSPLSVAVVHAREREKALERESENVRTRRLRTSYVTRRELIFSADLPCVAATSSERDVSGDGGAVSILILFVEWSAT